MIICAGLPVLTPRDSKMREFVLQSNGLGGLARLVRLAKHFSSI